LDCGYSPARERSNLLFRVIFILTFSAMYLVRPPNFELLRLLDNFPCERVGKSSLETLDKKGASSFRCGARCASSSVIPILLLNLSLSLCSLSREGFSWLCVRVLSGSVSVVVVGVIPSGCFSSVSCLSRRQNSALLGASHEPNTILLC
jgi:hypothetical protein